jgi:hypothetical protein
VVRITEDDFLLTPEREAVIWGCLGNALGNGEAASDGWSLDCLPEAAVWRSPVVLSLPSTETDDMMIIIECTCTAKSQCLSG